MCFLTSLCLCKILYSSLLQIDHRDNNEPEIFLLYVLHGVKKESVHWLWHLVTGECGMRAIHLTYHSRFKLFLEPHALRDGSVDPRLPSLPVRTMPFICLAQILTPVEAREASH